MFSAEMVLGLPGYELIEMGREAGGVRLRARHTGAVSCPYCGWQRLRSKGRCDRLMRHEDWDLRHCWIELEAREYVCRQCGRAFRQRFPGLRRWQRTSGAFQRCIFQWHLEGVNSSRLGRRESVVAATVERYFQRGLKRPFWQWHPPRCPSVLGLAEHFFTRRQGYATTLCDLVHH
jgi:DNA-directed RNA polymerase subunit RPC12/RpoP